MCAESNPRSMCSAACMLRTKRPAPINATVASPISDMTSRLRRRLLAADDPERPPALSISFTLICDERIAGASPNNRPVRIDIDAVNSRTRGSKLRSTDALPRNGGRNDHSAVRPQ